MFGKKLDKQIAVYFVNLCEIDLYRMVYLLLKIQ